MFINQVRSTINTNKNQWWIKLTSWLIIKTFKKNWEWQSKKRLKY